MQKTDSFPQWFFITIILGILILSTIGCTSVNHEARFENDFLPKPDTRIEVGAGAVTNDTGQTFNIDISKMFVDALNEALGNGNLLWMGGSSTEHLVITSKIVEYDEGSAFKRAILPGWGSTVLSVQCELKDSTSGKIIGSIESRRTVFGPGIVAVATVPVGLLTISIGAWQTIFESAAKDVVEELRCKIDSKYKCPINANVNE